MYVEGRVLTTTGEPIADAIIDTWEADGNGMWRLSLLPLCAHRPQGSMTWNTLIGPAPTAVGDCTPERMGALGIVLSSPPLIPLQLTCVFYLDFRVVTNSYWLQGPVGELFISQGRHNMRPSHLHIMVKAPGYRKLVTSFYPDGCDYLTSDPVFGVKQSLVVVCITFLQKLSCWSR